MSQQAIDLRRSIQIVRRHKRVFGVMVVVGLLLGAAYAVLGPPKLSSTALVLLPASLAAGGQSSAGVVLPDIATQVVIATSDSVLASALPHISPAMSIQALESSVQVQNVAGTILSFTASGKTAAQAETIANAVANSYIAYVGSPSSPVGQVPARVLESATTATGTKLYEQVSIFALLGALVGALVGFIVTLAIGRGQRRLVERDAIASSIGLPVLASIPVSRPSDAAAWVKLFEDYQPGVVHAWGLDELLRQFGVTNGGANGLASASGFSLTVLSLASDPGALALGPQLAAYTASLGIPTALVIGPQQDENATATLRIACAAPPQSAAEGRKPLRLVVSDHGYLGQMPSAFVVVVRVVDDQVPRMLDIDRTNATVLGVSAAAATAEQLARAARATTAANCTVVGILVADPDPDDQTTGRIPNLALSLRRSMPTRVNDAPTEIRR